MDGTSTPGSGDPGTPPNSIERSSPVTEQFTVGIDRGGGLDLFRGALVRKFRALTLRGCHCVILERTRVECHYVQAIVTPVGARIEAVGDTYLQADGFELTGKQAAMLHALNWHAPPGPGSGFACNWWQELGGSGFVELLVDQLLATLISVYHLEGDEPLAITIFPADCQRFEWIPDLDHPGQGFLDALE